MLHININDKKLKCSYSLEVAYWNFKGFPWSIDGAIEFERKKLRLYTEAQTGFGLAGFSSGPVLEILKLKENNNIPELPIILNSQSRMDEHSVQAIRQPELGQNIPNPAENKTSIKIFVPENSVNSYISIVNAMGQLITTRNLNTGDQLIEFNIMDFETGIYFYTLYINAIPFSTKRMVIVK